MNQFEFTRSLSFGQYLPIDSPIHRLEPRAKIVMVMAAVIGVTFATNLLAVILGLAIGIIFTALARIPLRFAARGIIGPAPFLALLAVLQAFVNPQPDVPPLIFQTTWLTFSVGDIWLGVALLLRFVALVLWLSLGSFTMSTTELSHGMDGLLKPLRKIGIPTDDFVMMLQVTLRFLPLLARTAERIAKAQASRGGLWGEARGGIWQRVRQVFPMIVPLFVISLRRSETMAMAMDARAYGVTEARTRMLVTHLTWTDRWVMVGSIAAATALIWI